LWGDVPEAEARGSLRTALTNLRKLVGPHLDINGETLSFNRHSSYWLDVELFQTALATAGLLPHKSSKGQTAEVLKPSEVFLAPLHQVVELYRGDFLEGFVVREALNFEEWLFSQRERLRQQVTQALLNLAKEHMARGEYAAGLDYTGRLLALESWREEGHRQMMLLLAKSGQRSAALAQYETCRRNLAEALDVEPSAETQTLYARLKAAAAPPPHNPPPQPTPFVGREAELARIANYLETPACHLVTLVGLGGVGKTRLALQSATANLELFQDGVFFVSLAAVDSVEALVAHIAAALNFSPGGPLEPKVQLLNYLRSKEMLLVLDNFEQLLPVPARGKQDGADWAVEILAAAPRLKIVTTSRERLNLQEEWVL
jgi:DNA-binding SARP family transcriptional activator